MAPFDFVLVVLAVLTANQLDKRLKVGDRLADSLIRLATWSLTQLTRLKKNQYKALPPESKAFVDGVKQFNLRYFRLIQKHKLQGYFLIFTMSFLFSPMIAFYLPNTNLLIPFFLSLIPAFYLVGFAYTDKKLRKRWHSLELAREAKEKKRIEKKEAKKKALEVQKDALKPTYKAWDVLVAVPLDLAWQYLKFFVMRVFLALTQFYPFSLFGQNRRGHYRNKRVTALVHIFEQETAKDGFPSEVVHVEMADQFYLLQFVLLRDVKTKVTDKFLRDIEFRFGLDQQSLFLRKNDTLENKIYNFDVIVPTDVVKELV